MNYYIIFFNKNIYFAPFVHSLYNKIIPFLCTTGFSFFIMFRVSRAVIDKVNLK